VLLLVALPLIGAETRDVGLTQKGAKIEAVAIAGLTEKSPTVRLVGGLGAGDRLPRSLRRVFRNVHDCDLDAARHPQRLAGFPYVPKPGRQSLARGSRGGGMALIFATEMAGEIRDSSLHSPFLTASR